MVFMMILGGEAIIKTAHCYDTQAGIRPWSALNRINIMR